MTTPSNTARLTIDSSHGQKEFQLTVHDQSRRLSDFLSVKGLTLNMRCNAHGLCKGCRVELKSGCVQNIHTAETVHGPAIIRACEHRASGVELHIAIPDQSLLGSRHKIVTDFHLQITASSAPLCDIQENVPALGVAVDIGTTSVVVLLVDLHTGKIIAESSMLNQQAQYGDDVITRIEVCTRDRAMVQRLQEVVIAQTLRPLIDQALAQAKAPSHQLRCITIAGNTTMLHLFAGVDPTPMGVVPFTPAFMEHRVCAELPGLSGFAHDLQIHLLPVASAYVGADIVAGFLASGMAYEEGPSLLVDIGTNGEILLKNKESILGCATAAGPAFEGVRLTSGMRGADGAIERISMRLNPFRINCRHIGAAHKAPRIGICGSAYVDFLAEARRIGLLTESGRFADIIPMGVARRLSRDDGKAALRIAKNREGKNIVVSESDIAGLLQAKAAIGAGIITLLERENIKATDLKTLYLAGGFGLHLNVAHAIGCGLLPGFQPKQVKVIGNSSLAGAYLALIDRGAMEELERLARQVEIVELNLDPRFEENYIDQLSL